MTKLTIKALHPISQTIVTHCRINGAHILQADEIKVLDRQSDIQIDESIY